MRRSNTDSVEKSEEALEFRWSLLGFAFTAMASFMQFRVLAGGGSEGDLHGLPDVAMFVSVLTSCCVWLGALLLLRCGKRLPNTIGVGIGGVSLALGLLVIYGMGAETPSSPGFVFLSGCVLLGVANGILLLLWGRVYGALTPKTALLNEALSGLAAVVFCGVMFTFVDSYIVQVLCWFALSLLSVFLLWRELNFASRESGVLDARPLKADDASIGDALSFLWRPITGVAVSAFILGSFWSSGQDAIHGILYQMLGYLVVTAVLVAILLKTRGLIDTYLIYQAFLPASAIVLLSSMGTLLGSEVLSGVIWNLCFALFDILAWGSLAIAVFVFKAPSDFVYGSKSLICSAAMLAGMVVGRLLSQDDLMIVFFALASLYALAFIMSLSLEIRGKNESPRQKGSSQEFDERCRSISVEHELSERESEVFSYLAVGRGSTYIADKLFLSPNTVKSHIQRIYKKLDVSTREELLDMVAPERMETR